jgi:hypothetical protein
MNQEQYIGVELHQASPGGLQPQIHRTHKENSRPRQGRRDVPNQGLRTHYNCPFGRCLGPSLEYCRTAQFDLIERHIEVLGELFMNGLRTRFIAFLH